MKRGVALPLALLTLGLIGALAVGGAFVARRHADDGRLPNDAELTAMAERALALTVSRIDSVATDGMQVGVTVTGVAFTAGGLVSQAWLTPLNRHSIWVVSEASDTRKTLLHKRLGAVARLGGPCRCILEGLTWFPLP